MPEVRAAYHDSPFALSEPSVSLPVSAWPYTYVSQKAFTLWTSKGHFRQISALPNCGLWLGSHGEHTYTNILSALTLV